MTKPHEDPTPAHPAHGAHPAHAPKRGTHPHTPGDQSAAPAGDLLRHLQATGETPAAVLPIQELLMKKNLATAGDAYEALEAPAAKSTHETLKKAGTWIWGEGFEPA